MSGQIFVVTFTDMDGNPRERSYPDRGQAEKFLRVVVHSYGYADGRIVLRGGEFSNSPRVREVQR